MGIANQSEDTLMTTKLSPKAQQILDSRSTNFWKDDTDVICFTHNSNVYKVVSINDFNADKLELIIINKLAVSIDLDPDGADTFKCVLTAQETATVVICIVECYQTKEETEATLGKFLTAITETTLNKSDGKDYHEIHADGSIARGVKDGIPYEQVLDTDGNTTYTVLVREDCLVGMYFSQDCYAVVEVGDGKDIKDTIREVKGKSEFVNNIRDEGNEGQTDDEIICENAYNELACPRWGMTW